MSPAWFLTKDEMGLQMPERIFVTYTNATTVPYRGDTLGHHAVLNYIDVNGNHYTLDGVPERKFDRNAEKHAFCR